MIVESLDHKVNMMFGDHVTRVYTIDGMRVLFDQVWRLSTCSRLHVAINRETRDGID